MTKELLFSVTKKDFEVEAMRAGGPGGQNQNKVSSAIRIRHQESGVVGESRALRHQAQNKKLAFRHLVDSPKFQAWLRIKTSRVLTGKSVEQIVEEQMDLRNLKFETVDDNDHWEEVIA